MPQSALESLPVWKNRDRMRGWTSHLGMVGRFRTKFDRAIFGGRAMVRVVLAGVCAALMVFSLPASAQQVSAPEAAATPVAAKAKKAVRKKVANRKAATKNAAEVIFVNKRASAVTEIRMTGKSGKASSMLKAPLAPGKKVTVRLRKNAGCTFSLDASFDDEAPFEPTQIDLCADKTINFTE
jgi:hypothetical protein